MVLLGAGSQEQMTVVMAGHSVLVQACTRRPARAGHKRHAMSTVPAGRAGRFHEVGFYRSDAEFRALIVAFVEEGVAAGRPVVIGYDDRKASLLRSWLSDPAAVTFIADDSLYATPARAIAS
jgi:hypothetical protein